MGRLAELRPNAVVVSARTLVELDDDGLLLMPPDGRALRLELARYQVTASDAERYQRFVRHLRFERRGEIHDLVTPPEEGAIAPRCARLPAAPAHAHVVDCDRFEVVSEWLAQGGSLRGKTVAELARLAIVATSAYAVHIGERAAEVAVEMTASVCGPLRGCGSARQILGPLIVAARRSERASEALVAALARRSVI